MIANEFCFSKEYNEVCSLFIENQQTIISKQLPAHVLDSLFEGSQLVRLTDAGCIPDRKQLSLVMRKPVFGVFEQARFKPVCSAKKASYRLEISDIETRDIMLFKQQITKLLISLRGCTGWSAPLLFAYGKNRFSHDVAQFMNEKSARCLWMDETWFWIWWSLMSCFGAYGVYQRWI